MCRIRPRIVAVEPPGTLVREAFCLPIKQLVPLQIYYINRTSQRFI